MRTVVLLRISPSLLKSPKKSLKTRFLSYQSQDIFCKPRFRTYHLNLYVLCQDNDSQRHDETFASSQELLNQNLHGDTTTEVARRKPSASRLYESQSGNE